jgi:hypothetical protein
MMEQRMNRLLNYNPELEFLNAGHVDRSSEYELEFGADLLEISNERDLGNFFADVITKVSGNGSRTLKSPLGKKLVDTLKHAAQPVLRMRSNATGGPTINTLVGVSSANDLKLMAAKIFGLELEGLSHEDKEFEVAQQFIRFAMDTIKRATESEFSDDPQRTVENALVQAARRHAPGFLSHGAQNLSSSGRWVRKGKHIIVVNC